MGIDAEMFVRTMTAPTEREVKRLGYELGSCFGYDKFFQRRAGQDPVWDAERRPIYVVKSHEQDGPTIHPRKGETFLRLSLWTRYYGEGYERGDIVFIIALADWLERRIPGAEVWYGGDSSGICAEKFDAKARASLFAHFVKHGHRPYHTGFGSRTNAACDFCEEPMQDFGGGGSYSFMRCAGCGEGAIVHHADGRRVVVKPGQDFFDVDPVTGAVRAKKAA